MRNHFLAEKYPGHYFLFDYFNLLIIQVDEGLYYCAVKYLSSGQTISKLEEIDNTSFALYSEDIIPLLNENIFTFRMISILKAITTEVFEIRDKKLFQWGMVLLGNQTARRILSEFF